jgi:hypothetical protein
MPRRIRILLALLASRPVSADAVDWWVPSDASMPSLIADGYVVVGFSTLNEQSPLMPLKVNRYLLQRNRSVFLCVEKMNATSSTTVQALCLTFK